MIKKGKCLFCDHRTSFMGQKFICLKTGNMLYAWEYPNRLGLIQNSEECKEWTEKIYQDVLLEIDGKQND